MYDERQTVSPCLPTIWYHFLFFDTQSLFGLPCLLQHFCLMLFISENLGSGNHLSFGPLYELDRGLESQPVQAELCMVPWCFSGGDSGVAFVKERTDKHGN